MIKINLITKTESANLEKLRDARKFYVENFDPVRARRLRHEKLKRAIDIARCVIDTAEAIIASVSDRPKLRMMPPGSIEPKEILDLYNKVKAIERTSNL